MNWNHRVVRVKDATTNETLYMLAEVFYNDDGTPAGYTAPFVHSETVGGLAEVINQMMLALTYPIINAEDMHYVEQDMDDEDQPKTRADVIRELAESVGVTVRDVPMPNYNAEDVCALCGRATPCSDCRL